MAQLHLSLAIIKPHVVKNPVAMSYIRNVIKDNFYVIKTKRIDLSIESAKKFYIEHKDKFFYNRLITFMSSGSVDVHIIAHTNAIECWRKILGPTKVYKAQFEDPDSLRGMFGLSDTRNVAHGSDSVDSAEREIKFFFPEFSLCQWYTEQESKFRKGHLEFNEDLFQHGENTFLEKENG